MSFIRRATDKDVTWARAWTADAIADLVAISAIGGTEGPRRGDLAFVTAESRYYHWMDDDSWIAYQPYSIELSEISVLTPTDGNIIVGNGSAWITESGNVARTSLGLGTGDSPQFAKLITTDLAALTTAAESWVGPSLANGIYFKSGNIGIGTTNPDAPLHVVGKLVTGNVLANDGAFFQVWGNSAGSARMMGTRSQNAPVGMILALRLDRGGGTTIVQSGDVVGFLDYMGHDGTTYRLAARINGVIDGTPGSTNMPGRLEFGTTPAGSVNTIERMRIDSAGNVGIGTTNPQAALSFGISSPGSMASNTAGLYSADIGGGIVAMRGIWEDGTVGTLGLVVTKTDTGDPTGHEGLFCINTFDNTFKTYADGAWRTLASGW